MPSSQQQNWHFFTKNDIVYNIYERGKAEQTRYLLFTVQQGRNQGVGWENQSSLEKISGYVLAVQGWKKYFSRGVYRIISNRRYDFILW
jgi:hypothetical protein